jgi:hypothetical protein
MTETEDRSDPAEFPITLGLFIKLMEAPEGDLDDVWEFGKAADEAIGVDGLLRGWDLVACFLLAALRHHANGCDCGSVEWLKREQLRAAEVGSDDV